MELKLIVQHDSRKNKFYISTDPLIRTPMSFYLTKMLKIESEELREKHVEYDSDDGYSFETYEMAQKFLEEYIEPRVVMMKLCGDI